MINEYALKSKETVNIIPVGDFHIGSSQFNYEFFNKMWEHISTLKRRRIYLMGDLLECANKSTADASYNQDMNLEDQRALLIDTLKPYSNDIVGYVLGNHEYRLIKDYGYNIVKDMCRELDIPYYNQYIDSFKINDFDFDVMFRHGKGSSKKKHLAMGKLERNTEDIIADLYLEGHNHKLLFWNEFKRFHDGYKRIYYGYTGSCLNYSGYPDRSYLQLEPPAYQIITINQNRKVKSNMYFCDETYPNINYVDNIRN